MNDYNKRVEDTVERLRRHGANVRVKRRKLTHRKKTYLNISAGGTHRTYTTLAILLIRKNFPEAYMTSGDFTPEWVPDPRMNITISLDPR